MTKQTKLRRKKLSTFQTIVLGFMGLIIIGALLLMMPFSSATGGMTPFFDCLFTATSACCVTGLIVRDTATSWSVIGQTIIIVLIQIGGLGIVTTLLSVVQFSGRKMGLKQKQTLQDAISGSQMGGIEKMMKFILLCTFSIEFAGGLCLLPVFLKQYPALKAIRYSFFHSVSAFCNAGFDLFGEKERFSSLTTVHDNAYLNIVLMLLIIMGGFGFFTYKDILNKKFRFKRFRLQTKLCIIVTVILIFVPAVLFFFFEYSEDSMKTRVLHSLFQSVTARTAGFNTANLDLMSDSGKLVMIVLMLIGGCPGSTAGGMKTTTIAVTVMTVGAVFRRRENVRVFGRRINDKTGRDALTILSMYLTLFITGGIVISKIEGLPLLTCLYETASAVGTAGVTLGITTSLGAVSKCILIFMMFFGRVGGLTIIYSLSTGYRPSRSRFPEESVSLG